MADELVRGLGLLRRLHLPRAIEQVDERARVDEDLVLRPLLPRLLLSEAHGADHGVREHHGRHVGVVRLRVSVLLVPAEEAVSQPAAGSDGHRGELHVTAHVTERVDALDRSLLVLIHNNVARRLGVDARDVERQRCDERLAPNGHHDRVKTTVHVSVLEFEGEGAIVGLGDGLRGRARHHGHASFLHRRVEVLAENRVEAAESLVTAHEEARRATKLLEDAGKLNRNVASTNNSHLLRLLLEEEEAVRVDAVLDARDGRHYGLAADGDVDVVGRVGRVAHLDRVRAIKAGEALDEGHARVLEVARVDTVETLDVKVAHVLDGGPVERGAVVAVVEAVLLGGADHLVHHGRVEHDLLRHTPHVHASAAQSLALHHAHLGTIHGRAARRGDATTAAADYKVVEVGVRVHRDRGGHRPCSTGAEAGRGAQCTRKGTSRARGG
mmetsp:Transcript_13380/g.28253  ORF Transcript_13380/g.28253 Transcript_13380/m.28253 type:complete len:440 (+) Transcript_13380:380-1699(+)